MSGLGSAARPRSVCMGIETAGFGDTGSGHVLGGETSFPVSSGMASWPRLRLWSWRCSVTGPAWDHHGLLKLRMAAWPMGAVFGRSSAGGFWAGKADIRNTGYSLRSSGWDRT